MINIDCFVFAKNTVECRVRNKVLWWVLSVFSRIKER